MIFLISIAGNQWAISSGIAAKYEPNFEALEAIARQEALVQAVDWQEVKKLAKF